MIAESTDSATLLPNCAFCFAYIPAVSVSVMSQGVGVARFTTRTRPVQFASLVPTRAVSPSTATLSPMRWISRFGASTRAEGSTLGPAVGSTGRALTSKSAPTIAAHPVAPTKKATTKVVEIGRRPSFVIALSKFSDPRKIGAAARSADSDGRSGRRGRRLKQEIGRQRREDDSDAKGRGADGGQGSPARRRGEPLVVA